MFGLGRGKGKKGFKHQHGRGRGFRSNEDVSLLDLSPGEEATIHGLNDNDETHMRLRELGLNNGTPIRLIKYAPLGDPVEIKVRGYYLSLRKNLAKHIRVRRRQRGGAWIAD